jgi:ribonuclease P protein component
VDRNRLKRRLREIIRCEILPLLSGVPVDIVVRTTSQAYDVSFETLRLQLVAAVDRVVDRGQR